MSLLINFFLGQFTMLKNTSTVLSTNPLQRGGCKGVALNTAAMPLDRANGPTMVVLIFLLSLFC
jgi:hypothetical protein